MILNLHHGCRIYHRFAGGTPSAICLIAVLAACAHGEDHAPFSGRDLDGWTMLDGSPVNHGWEIVDGMVHLNPSKQGVGHIITRRDYGDFDLRFEWKIARGGNSGLKYRVRNYDGIPLGCEYQIVDDVNYRKLMPPAMSAGALYDLYEPNKQKRVRPLGEFNTARIVVSNNTIQHWLNGRMILSATAGSEDWKARVARSKFSDLRDFALNRNGKIMLTDHGSEVWFRKFEFTQSPGAD